MLVRIMKKQIYIIVILILLVENLCCQVNYRELYDEIHQMQMNSYDILYKKNYPLFLRIILSKRQSKNALKLAYDTIKNNECDAYDIIIDRIIELELRLGHVLRAEKIALERLEKLNPKWRNIDSPVDYSHLSVLALIQNSKNTDKFYKRVRKHKLYGGFCDEISYETDVQNLEYCAKNIFEGYGPIYCYKYLQNSKIVVNEDKEYLNSYWNTIYELLIHSIATNTSYSEIKYNYEHAEIQKDDSQEINEYLNLPDWPCWDISMCKSQYHFELGGIKLYFKTTICPTEQYKHKRCQPIDCNELKLKSELYRKIIKYAS